MHCSYCFNDEFNSSRLRFSDVLQLVRFRVPVRCTHCHLRQFESVGIVRKYMKFRDQQRKAA